MRNLVQAIALACCSVLATAGAMAQDTVRIAGEGTPSTLRDGTLLERVYLGGHA